METNKPNKIDAYVCPDLHIMITTISESTPEKSFVPKMIVCETCKLPAQSLNFRVNQSLEPTMEWFRPDPDQMKAEGLKMNDEQFKQYTDYINKGGLMLREIKKPV